ncbi:hypothetical protein M5K25_007946 [Dendrobium thyrsiflorum]|uniref:Uncharacterized protein n=1 Tax=Dendrobium thyrsiflorum TaxID=117978 RepID=A0ABD0V755_DENTH
MVSFHGGRYWLNVSCGSHYIVGLEDFNDKGDILKRMGKKNSPADISDLPGNLHLFRGPLVQVLQGARQLVLNGRRFLLPLRFHRTLSHTAERRSKKIISKHRVRKSRSPSHPSPPNHAPKRARESKELREDIISVPRIKPKNGRPVAAGEESRAAGSGATARRRRNTAFKPFLPILIINSTLLGIAQDLKQNRSKC